MWPEFRRGRSVRFRVDGNIEAGKECRHFSGEDLSGLSEALEELLVYGDCVLLKGSRSMKLDQVAKRLVPCIADN